MKAIYIKFKIDDAIKSAKTIKKEINIFLSTCSDDEVIDGEMSCLLFCEDVVVKDLGNIEDIINDKNI